MTQGYESNHSGKFLEGLVHNEFSARGFIFRNYGDDADNLDLFAPRVVVRRVPYVNLYKRTSFSEYVITEHSRRVRVECRWQEVSGSVDEKFPYLLENAEYYMPEPEVLILHGGDGAKKEAILYASERAARCTSKRLWVLNVNEFPRWVRNEFIRSKRVAA